MRRGGEWHEGGGQDPFRAAVTTCVREGSTMLLLGNNKENACNLYSYPRRFQIHSWITGLFTQPAVNVISGVNHTYTTHVTKITHSYQLPN